MPAIDRSLSNDCRYGRRPTTGSRSSGIYSTGRLTTGCLRSRLARRRNGCDRSWELAHWRARKKERYVANERCFSRVLFCTFLTDSNDEQDVYTCDYHCGFTGSHADVSAHERNCSMNSTNAPEKYPAGWLTSYTGLSLDAIRAGDGGSCADSEEADKYPVGWLTSYAGLSLEAIRAGDGRRLIAGERVAAVAQQAESREPSLDEKYPAGWLSSYAGLSLEAIRAGDGESCGDDGSDGQWEDGLEYEGGSSAEAPILSGSSYYSNPVPPLETMMLYASAQQGRIVPALRCMLIEVERVKKHGISEEEIERVKADILADLETAYRERNQIPSAEYAEECCEHFLREEPVMELVAELAMW